MSGLVQVGHKCLRNTIFAMPMIQIIMLEYLHSLLNCLRLISAKYQCYRHIKFWCFLYIYINQNNDYVPKQLHPQQQWNTYLNT